MPYLNAWALCSLEGPDFDLIAKISYHLTAGPFGVVVSSLNSQKTDPSHPVRNSLWLKKNRASDNEGKFHSFLMCRIWIYSQNFFHIWTSELGCICNIFGKFGSFQVLQHWQQSFFKKNWGGNNQMLQLYWSTQKMCQREPNSDVQLWN